MNLADNRTDCHLDDDGTEDEYVQGSDDAQGSEDENHGEDPCWSGGHIDKHPVKKSSAKSTGEGSGMSRSKDKGKTTAESPKRKGGPIPAAAWAVINAANDTIDDLIESVEQETGVARERICEELGILDSGPTPRDGNLWNVVQTKYAQDSPKEAGGE